MPEYWFVSIPCKRESAVVTFQNFKAKIGSSQNDLSEVTPFPIAEFKVMNGRARPAASFDNEDLEEEGGGRGGRVP